MKDIDITKLILQTVISANYTIEMIESSTY